MGAKNNPGHKKKPSKMNYNAQQKWAKNKELRIAKHKKRHPNDLQEVGTVPTYATKKKYAVINGLYSELKLA